jgi:hypothetical protein
MATLYGEGPNRKRIRFNCVSVSILRFAGSSPHSKLGQILDIYMNELLSILWFRVRFIIQISILIIDQIESIKVIL